MSEVEELDSDTAFKEVKKKHIWLLIVWLFC